MPDLLSVLAVSEDLDLTALIQQAHWVVKLVMALLALMSVACWYIIGYKYFYIRRAQGESKQFLDAFWRSRDIEQIYKYAQTLTRSPVAAMFSAGYTELAKLATDTPRDRADRESDLDNVKRALRRAQTFETTRLDSMVPFLATTGSAAPFIGLFGTVFGIMNSFRSMSGSSANIQTVAPGIAEALFATAIGLVAAIPAVIAYNYFIRRVRVSRANMETFEQDYLNIIRRHFLN